MVDVEVCEEGEAGEDGVGGLEVADSVLVKVDQLEVLQFLQGVNVGDLVIAGVELLKPAQRLERGQVVHPVVVYVQTHQRLQHAQSLQVHHPVLRQTQQLYPAELLYAEVLGVLELLEAQAAQHQAPNLFHAALGIPEHGALEDEAALQFGL